MGRVLENREPKEVLYWFEEICRYPHGSFNEKALSDYLMHFARERGFAVRQDEVGNLAVEVPGTPGYETHPKTILQAHLDMVCKKEEGAEFDFTKDPLTLYVEDGWIRARHTTLGADNGCAVAMILAVLDSKTLPHPPLQVLFTTSEEVACTGAGKMDDSWPDGEYLLNMDVFRDDALMLSCAGISINRIEWDAAREAVEKPEGKTAFSLSVTGLKGGHSGEEIHEGRANAISVMAELLVPFADAGGYDLLEIRGEGLFNVISTVSKARIAVEKDRAAAVRAKLEELSRRIRQVYESTDPDMQIEIAEEPVEPEARRLAPAVKENLLALIYTAPVGMHKPMNTPCTLACSSSNLGSLKEENGTLCLVMSIRSNPEYRHDQLLRIYELLCASAGARMVTDRRIASWEYNPDSPLREKACEVYAAQNGRPPELIWVHSGVEVATFLTKLRSQGREADAIAFGCRIENAHSPEEALEIASLAKTYRFLTGLLEVL